MPDTIDSHGTITELLINGNTVRDCDFNRNHLDESFLDIVF